MELVRPRRRLLRCVRNARRLASLYCGGKQIRQPLPEMLRQEGDRGPERPGLMLVPADAASCWALSPCASELLRHDVPAGGEHAFLVHLDEGLLVPVEPFHEDGEVLWQHADGGEELHDSGQDLEELQLLFDQGGLVAAEALVGMEEHLEACLLDSRPPFVCVPEAAKPCDLPGLVEQLPVLWVALVVAVEHDAIQDGHLRPRLQDPRDLTEHRLEVLGIGHGLDLVERVKGSVRERQGVVHVGLLELQLAALQQAGLIRVLRRDGQLSRVDVDADDLCTRARGHVVGDAPPAATDLQRGLARAQGELVREALFEEQLILEDPHGGVDDRRDVHLLDAAEGAQAVQDPVVVLHLRVVLLAVDVERAGIPLENLEGTDEVVQLLGRYGVQRCECLIPLRDPVAHLLGAHVERHGHSRGGGEGGPKRQAPHAAPGATYGRARCLAG
mmetsp:Transcript_50589/g.161868  ORF Transcript_50589/g.161868 Transcript_50589/m.161868 type:complete len:444 (+) Transcript_50589:212-1543(+)